MARISVKSLLLPALAALALLTGCSDDDGGTPPPTPPFFPTSLGTYWIYQHQPTDPSGNAVGATTIDSVIINALAQNVYGRNAMHVVTYNLGSSTQDTLVASIDDTTVYALFELPNPLDGSTTPMWIKVLDANKASWVSFDTTMSNVLPTQAGTFNATVNVHVEGSNGGQKSVTPPAGNYNATQYIVASTVTVTVNDTPIGNVSRTIRDTTIYDHVRGIGFVTINDRPSKSTDSNPLLSGLVPPTVDSGSVQTLLRFTIK